MVVGRVLSNWVSVTFQGRTVKLQVGSWDSTPKNVEHPGGFYKHDPGGSIQNMSLNWVATSNFIWM